MDHKILEESAGYFLRNTPELERASLYVMLNKGKGFYMCSVHLNCKQNY